MAEQADTKHQITISMDQLRWLDDHVQGLALFRKSNPLVESTAIRIGEARKRVEREAARKGSGHIEMPGSMPLF